MTKLVEEKKANMANKNVALISNTLVDDPMFTPKPYYAVTFRINDSYNVTYYEYANTPFEAESIAWFRAAWRSAND